MQTEKVGAAEARDIGTDGADRDFVLAAVRTARTKLQLMSCQLDEIGVALKNDMLPLERAVEWLHEVDALQIVNPDVWRTPPGVAA